MDSPSTTTCGMVAPRMHPPSASSVWCSTWGYIDAQSCESLGIFGWEIAHAAVSRRPPISLDTMVPVPGATRTTMGFGICPSFKGPFSVAPCHTSAIRDFFIAVYITTPRLSVGTYQAHAQQRRRATEHSVHVQHLKVRLLCTTHRDARERNASS
jgi:hypothetical protein